MQQNQKENNCTAKSKSQWTNAIAVFITLTGYILSKHFDYKLFSLTFAIIGMVTIISLLIPKNISKITTIFIVILGFSLNTAVFSEQMFFETGSRELGLLCLATAVVALSNYWKYTRKLEQKKARRA